MGTYNPFFQNDLQMNECPICSKAIPLDWFGREVKEDVRDQHTGKVVGVRRRREAISFNGDGFIGIAGWADDNNVQPFLRAFMRWLKEWMGCKHPFAFASDNAAAIASQPIFAPAC